ncbi:hypothetical protein FOE67_01095 [Streptomyces calidiresistens]|uniref:Uncharacterized protein n=1 Tax=Streptomyces calidiresistens TaxID=1485586 RepID=A0A7W3SZH4_9ACTN|nr:hypothetical protein [Streptomyces calidiresistens]
MEPAGPFLRGSNQELVFLPAPLAPAARAVPAGRSGVPGAGVPSLLSGPSVPAAAAASVTCSRTTTGGIGREPGMLIRIRVVTVVSVFFSAGAPATSPSPASGRPGRPYGSRPAGPGAGVSVSRLKAGSPDWCHQPTRRAAGAGRRAPPYWGAVRGISRARDCPPSSNVDANPV